MKITAVEKSRNNDMMRISIDNKYAFSIPEEEYIRNNLYEMEEISTEQLDNIRKTVLVHTARERAVRYLTIKDRSEGELVKKLIQAGFDEDVARNATDELKTIGYLDDTRYAMKYLSERIRTKALSKKALCFELSQKGIAPEIIEKAISEFDTDDYEVALREARRKFGKYDAKDMKIRQKILRFLMHRGFQYEISDRVIKAMTEK